MRQRDKILSEISRGIYLTDFRSSNSSCVTVAEPVDGILKHDLAGQHIEQTKMVSERYAIAKLAESILVQDKRIGKHKKSIDSQMKHAIECDSNVKKLKEKIKKQSADLNYLDKELTDVKKLVKEQRTEIKQLKKIVKSFCVFLEISKHSDSLEITQKKCMNKLGGVNYSMISGRNVQNEYPLLTDCKY